MEYLLTALLTSWSFHELTHKNIKKIFFPQESKEKMGKGVENPSS